VETYPPTRGKPNTDVASSKVGIGETAQSEKEKPGFITLEAKTGEIYEEAAMPAIQVDAPCRPSRSEAAFARRFI